MLITLRTLTSDHCRAIVVQVTLDDMWSLDLAKLNGWNLVKDNTAGHEDFAEGEDSASESSGDDADNECSRML